MSSLIRSLPRDIEWTPRGRETRRRGGTGESGKLRWPTDRPRGETRRWTDDGFREAKEKPPSARLGRTGWSTGWKRPRPRRDETSARLAHAPKPSGGWQTVRGGGSVDHLPLVGVTRRIFLLSLLHRPSSTSLSLRRRPLVSCTVRAILCVSASQSPQSLVLLSSWKTVKSEIPVGSRSRISHHRVFFSFFLFY